MGQFIDDGPVAPVPTWGQIGSELLLPANQTPQGVPDFDRVRRKYLADLHRITGRAVILYATAWTEARPAPPQAIQVALGDVQGFMEAVSNVSERDLDLILHSPGGQAEAAESIMGYLRQCFDNIRVIVPLAAMSAATMMALGADTIVMGQHSQLGPIDPQFSIITPEGPRTSPAKAILDQFEQAKGECAADQTALAAWLPILRGYGPGLLAQCVAARQLSKDIVRRWLMEYMFASDPDRAGRADRVSDWFSDYDNFASHGRAVGVQQAEEQGLKVERLEANQALQDAVLSVFHATTHTFAGTGASKIIENHAGRAYIILTQASVVVGAAQGPAAPVARPPSAGAPASAARTLSRGERRRQQRGQ